MRIGMKGGGVADTSGRYLATPSVLAHTYATAKYHSFTWDGTNEPRWTNQSAFDLGAWPIGNPDDENDYAVDIMEPVNESRAEVPIAVAVFRNINGGQTVNFKWIRDSDGTLLFEFDYDIPTGNWGYYFVVCWIGHFKHELIEAGSYHAEITSPYGNSTLPITCSGEGKIMALEFKSDKTQANAGELITLSGQVDNQGSVSDNTRLLITDADDGTLIAEWITSALPPDVPFDPYILIIPPSSAVMPARNFRIKLETFHET